MGNTITAIENAILEKIQVGIISSALGVRTVKTYGGELDSEEAFTQAQTVFPAIFVVYSGSRYLENGARKIERPRFSVIVAHRNLRSEAAGRRGDSTTSGAYDILDAVRDLLCGSMFGLTEVQPMEILRTQLVFMGKGLHVYASEYEMGNLFLYHVSAT